MIRITALALAAAFAVGIAAAEAAPQAQIVTNGPQVNPGDVGGSWSARQDRIESRRYDHLVAADPAFRAYRIRKECGPVTDPRLHAKCVASFQ